MRLPDTLIVGGGPAGCAAAIALARAGAPPLLIERRPAPAPLVCGGFLGWDTIARLAELGIDPLALGARPITRVRLVVGTHASEITLPHAAAGLSRVALDTALLAAARSAGVAIVPATARAFEDGAIRLDDGAVLAPRALVLATGKHGLRGAPRAGATSGSVGLRCEVAGAGLDDVIELHFFRGGHAGLLLQEDGRANLCLSLSPARLTEAGGVPDRLIEHLAAEAPRLAERVRDRGAWSSVAGVPYGWRARGGDGLYRVGDQAAVIASVAGDGIAIALASGAAAARAILAGEAPDRFQDAFSRRATRPLRLAEAARFAGERPWLTRALHPLAARLPGVVRALAGATRLGH